MDYFSNIREVKNLIVSLLCQNLCTSDLSMRYIKLGEEVDSIENLQDLMQDMFSAERLNLDMNIKNLCDISSSGSENMSELCGKGLSASCSEDSINYGGSVAYKTWNSSGTSINVSNHDNRLRDDLDENTFVLINREEKEETELPYKFIVTYTFDFDIDDDVKQVSESVEELDAANTSGDDFHGFGGEDDDDFEVEFFNGDCDVVTDQLNLNINGSKNNLLDDMYTPEESQNNGIGLVDYDSTSEDDDSDKDNDSTDLYTVNCDRMLNESKQNKPHRTNMRKGYIYYSSELRLYSGELNYETMVPQKKYKFVRKLFKKVFPSQKYVVNA